jgi:putative intracellular protease/amidase
MQDQEARTVLANTCVLADLSADEFDAVFYPGGHGPLWDLAENPASISLIESMHAAGKPVAAVCHAPAVLKNAKMSDGTPLVAGKSLTGFSNSEEAAVQLTDVVPFLLQDELSGRGASYQKADDWQPHAVVDGNLITGQNPASSELAARAVLDHLK